MTPNRFNYLFQRYKDDLLSQEEWNELRSALQSGVYDDYVREDMAHRIGYDRKAPVRRLVWSSAIAASVLVCLTLVWLLHPAPQRVQLAKQFSGPNNVLPGGTKAILTLSNGQRIVLDSVSGGKIAVQGTATIVRTGGGIGYTSSNDSGKAGDSGETLYNTVTTPKGGQYAIELADGSKVWLNSASSIRFPTVFKGAERMVELTGEGYFEIRKNVRMPFSVLVGQMKVQVLGTHFDIMAYSDESTINTTLIEGAVAVRAGEQVQRLLPGEQVALAADHRMTLRQADIEKTMAWKNGFFEFDQMDLAAIMRQVARWYDVEIVYQTAPDHTALGGSIGKGLSLAEVLNLLEADGLHHFKIEGKKVYVN